MPRRSVIGLQVVVIASLSLLLYSTLTSRSSADTIRATPPPATDTASIIEAFKHPQRTVPSLYIAAKPHATPEFLQIYQTTVVPDGAAARQAAPNSYQVLYIDQVALASVDPAWLRGEYARGVLIVGVNIKISTLAQLAGITTEVDDLAERPNYMMISMIHKNILISSGEFVGSGEFTQYYKRAEALLPEGTRVHFARLEQ